MAGSKAGGIKTVATIKERDPDFYRKIGAIGGRKKGLKGFALHPELAKAAGRKGGAMGKRQRVESPLEKIIPKQLSARRRVDIKRQIRQAVLEMIGEDVAINGLQTDGGRMMLQLLNDYQAELRKKAQKL